MGLEEVPSAPGMPGRLQRRGVRVKDVQQWAKGTQGRGEGSISGKGREVRASGAGLRVSLLSTSKGPAGGEENTTGIDLFSL